MVKSLEKKEEQLMFVIKDDLDEINFLQEKLKEKLINLINSVINTSKIHAQRFNGYVFSTDDGGMNYKELIVKYDSVTYRVLLTIGTVDLDTYKKISIELRDLSLTELSEIYQLILNGDSDQGLDSVIVIPL